MAPGTTRARWAAIVLVLIVVAGASSAAGPASGGGGPVLLRDQSDAPITLFVARRPTFEVKLWVDPWGIVFTRTGSVVHCEGGSKEYGSITSQGLRHFPVDRRGEFERGVWEVYEGSGSYFTRLTGSVRADSVTGEYTAWEQRTGEEEFFPKCGTRSFRGEPMRFRAHRVAGPRWHSAR